MTATKEIFLANRELSDWLHGIVVDDRLRQSLVYVRAAFMDTPGLTPDQIRGAQLFEAALVDLPELEKGTDYPAPKVHHGPPNIQPKKT